ncbi:hypothetical protein [uncultured Tenacibaculum sp.]|uniref:hypothetical protein n=1 Tax=uncultured Tenacibaculum sp. TaxID=174713 RepID=UPI0026140CBF|nr:hypothetical protein [uncultured Tenacibaculum sp.]
MVKNIFKYILLFLVLLGCTKEGITFKSTSFLEQLDFVKTIGGSKNEVAKSVIKTPDGGYAILGYTQSNDIDFSQKNNTSFDYAVLKFSSDDKLEWKKTYGGSNDDRGEKIISTSDGGYAILGYTKSNDIDITNNAGDRDFWLVKLNPTGTIIWQKTFGYIGKDIGTTLIETDDNGFLIAGELDVTSSGGLGNSKSSAIQHAGGDMWALKLNSLGAIEWSKYYGGTFTDTPHGIVKTDDGYIIAGISDSSDVDITNNKGSYDFWVIKINKKGKLLWNKNFGGTEIDEAKAIVSTNDNNFLIVGNTRSTDKDVTNNKGGADLWVIKINSNGGLVWQKNFGGNNFDVGNSIKKMSDGNYLLSGSSRSADNGITNKGQNDAWILKISPDGSLLWQKTIGGTEIDFCYDVVELNNGTIVGVGESSSNNNDITNNKGFSDLLIIKYK